VTDSVLEILANDESDSALPSMEVFFTFGGMTGLLVW